MNYGFFCLDQNPGGCFINGARRQMITLGLFLSPSSRYLTDSGGWTGGCLLKKKRRRGNSHSVVEEASGLQHFHSVRGAASQTPSHDAKMATSPVFGLAGCDWKGQGVSGVTANTVITCGRWSICLICHFQSETYVIPPPRRARSACRPFEI